MREWLQIEATTAETKTKNQRQKMKNTANQIETGSIVKFIYGAQFGEECGIVVEINETQWGTQYKIITDEGEVQFTSEIREMGERTANGSPIGCFLVTEADM